MATCESVDLDLEETGSEVESMLSVVFDEDDKRKLISQRRMHETRHRHKQPTKDSLMLFINFEVRLLRLIHLRQQKAGLINTQNKGRVVTLEMTIKKRLNRLFMVGMRTFPNELKIWISFLRFCKQYGMCSDGSKVLDQLLWIHGANDYELYLMAGEWEADYCRNLDRARIYLMRGIHQHTNNKELLKAAFKLELRDTAHRRKECSENNEILNLSNPLMTTANAELLFDGAIKRLKDVDMMNELLKLSTSYDFTDNLYRKINEAIFECKDDERMWNIIAQRELNDTSEKISLKDQIKQSMELYDKAVKKFNTRKMWAFYLDALLELNKELTTLPNYKRKLLYNALQRCANNNKLDEKYYLLWVGYLQGNDKHKKLVDMLNQGVRNLPESVKLWLALLTVHLNRNEDKQASDVFDRGVTALRNKGLPLWEVMIEFELLKRKNKVDTLYRRGIEMVNCPMVRNSLIPAYLTWLVMSQSVLAARKAYDQQIGQEPCCLQMHLKMAELERFQPVISVKHVRKCYTFAICEFPDNVNVWVEYCKFVLEYESVDKFDDLLAEAAKRLDKDNYDSLCVQMNIAQSIPSPSHTINLNRISDCMDTS